MTTILAPQLEAFRSVVAARLGLAFAEDGLDPLPELLDMRMRATGAAPFEAYMRLLGDPAAAEWRALATALTIGETYFFRHPDHFRVFTEVVLPALRGAGRGVRLLSAGCASGEEAYSLAILAAEHAPGLEVEVVGVDLNPDFIARAREARYSPWSLRGVPEATIHRYFAPDGATVVLREPYRGGVRFEERNLLDDAPEFWQPEAFDVVFFRNVGIYFSPEATQAMIRRFAQAIRLGGYLFLGPAESLRGSCENFQLVGSHETFYYRRGAAKRPTDLAAASWAEVIGRSASRVEKLPSARPAPAERPLAPAFSRASVLGLFAAERFAEALAALEALPPGEAARPEIRLLAAAALATMGRIEEAERACHDLLAQEPERAGAHYLLALCRDQAGDPLGARRHDERAAALDPSFAMPRLHLGLLAVRQGDLETARRELNAALGLLASEAGERLTLFGGGFGRAALEAMCRAELKRLEASRE